MTRRLGAAGTASMVVALVLTIAAVLLGASSAGAAPTTVPLTFEFTGLRPGESQSQSRTYHLGRDARVVSVTIGTTPGATWTALLCRQGTCADVLAMRAGHDLAAGDYDLRVGVTATSLLPGDVSSIGGRLAFVETGTGNLAQTGSDPWSVSLAALATTVLGLFLVVAARRRREGPRQPAQTCHADQRRAPLNPTKGPTS